MNLPTPYDAEYRKLIATINDLSDIREKRKTFNDFTKKYTTIPSIWTFWISCELENSIADQKLIEFLTKLSSTSLSHFFEKDLLDIFYIFLDGSVMSCLPETNQKFVTVITRPYILENLRECGWKKSLAHLKEALTLPHHFLEHVFSRYEQYSKSPVSREIKKMFEKSYNLCKNLNHSFEQSDVKSWFSTLFQTENKSFIIQNMEYYISKKRNQKSGWKVYIKFMATVNTKAMLGVYSRYCRYFLDDNEMKKEYHQKVLDLYKIGENVSKWLFDSLDILYNFDGMTLSEILHACTKNENIIPYDKSFQKLITKYYNYNEMLQSSNGIEYSDVWFMKNNFKLFKTFDASIFNEKKFLKPTILQSPKKKLIKWNNSNLKYQNFAFCSDIIRYISENYECRQKLYQTCKYFFAKFQKTPICYNFTVCNGCPTMKQYEKNSLMLSADFLNRCSNSSNKKSIKFLKTLKSMIITTAINFENPSKPKSFMELFNTFKDMLPIKYLSLKYQTLTLKDIRFINQACRRLISCKLQAVDIISDSTKNNNFATIEEVILHFCELKYLRINCETLIYTSETAMKLANLPLKTKFQEFYIYNATTDLNAESFCEFLKNCTAANCIFFVYFLTVPALFEFERIFYHTVGKYLNEWKNSVLYDSVPSFLIV